MVLNMRTQFIRMDSKGTSAVDELNLLRTCSRNSVHDSLAHRPTNLVARVHVQASAPERHVGRSCRLVDEMDDIIHHLLFLRRVLFQDRKEAIDS